MKAWRELTILGACVVIGGCAAEGADTGFRVGGPAAEVAGGAGPQAGAGGAPGAGGAGGAGGAPGAGGAAGPVQQPGPAAAAPASAALEPPALPQASATCAAVSLTAALDPALASEGGEACLQEAFGADGCPEERWERDFDALGRKVREEYTILEDRVREGYFYVVPESWVATWTLDEQGRALQETWTGLETGSSDVTDRAYDAEGRLVWQLRTSTTPWGASTTEETRTWHPTGELLRREVVETSGAFVYTVVVDRLLADDGRLLEEVERRDGAVFQTIVMTWDGTKQLARMVTGPQGQTLSITDWTWNDAGFIEEERVQRIDNGWTERTVFDAAGNELRFEEDSDLDGVADYVVASTYDADGRKTGETTTYDKWDGGLVVDDHAWTYDAAGRLVLHRHAPGWDPQRIVETATAWGEGESRIEVMTVHVAGALASRTESRFDEAGEEVLEIADTDGDGAPEQVRTWTFDALGLLVADETDVGGDGTVDIRVVHLRDAAGRLLETRTDADGDGLTDHRVALRHGC